MRGLRERTLNPVLAREIKERLRSRRATIVIVVYLAMLAFVLQALYWTSDSLSSFNSFDGQPSAASVAILGRRMFEVLVLAILGLIFFIIPGLTADALSGERERQTLVPLQVSLLRPISIVVGKVLSSVVFTGLLVLATLPLFAVSFMVGGVTPGAIVKAVVALLLTAWLVASITMACSALASRTQSSVVLAYALSGLVVIGPPLSYLAQDGMDGSSLGPPSVAVLVLSPFAGTADAIGGPTDLFGLGQNAYSPLQEMRSLIFRREKADKEDLIAAGGNFMQVDGGEMVAVDDRGNPLKDRVFKVEWPERIPFWIRSTSVLGLFSFFALLIATLRIRTPLHIGKRRRRFRRKLSTKQ